MSKLPREACSLDKDLSSENSEDIWSTKRDTGATAGTAKPQNSEYTTLRVTTGQSGRTITQVTPQVQQRQQQQQQRQQQPRQYAAVARATQQQQQEPQQQQEQSQKILETSPFHEQKKMQITRQQEEIMNKVKFGIMIALRTFVRNIQNTITEALLNIPETRANHNTVWNTIITMGESMREVSIQLTA